MRDPDTLSHEEAARQSRPNDPASRRTPSQDVFEHDYSEGRPVIPHRKALSHALGRHLIPPVIEPKA